MFKLKLRWIPKKCNFESMFVKLDETYFILALPDLHLTDDELEDLDCDVDDVIVRCLDFQKSDRIFNDFLASKISGFSTSGEKYSFFFLKKEINPSSSKDDPK